MDTLSAVLAAIDAAEKLYQFVSTTKTTLSQTDQATVEAALTVAISGRHTQQSETDPALDAAAKIP